MVDEMPHRERDVCARDDMRLEGMRRETSLCLKEYKISSSASSWCGCAWVRRISSLLGSVAEPFRVFFKQPG